MKFFLFPASGILIACLASCQRPLPESAVWEGTLRSTSGRDIPIRFQLDVRSTPPVAAFMNGDERIPVPEVILRRDTLTFVFSEYLSAMTGRWDGSRWTGRVYRYRADTTFNEFTAAPVSGEPASTPTPAPAVPLVGTFRVFGAAQEGRVDSSMTATFRQQGDSVFGTLIAPDGDFGLLAGIQKDDQVVLSRFTGWQAFRLELNRTGGIWQAELFGRIGGGARYTLESRTPKDASPLAEKTTTPANPRERFAFRGIGLDGRTVTNLDSAFAGRALVVDIMGTWCHNCMDAAPLLRKLQAEFHDRGLTVVGLAFELRNDPALGRRNLELYAARYGITFPVLFCGSTQSAAVDTILKRQLKDFYAYPTTLFIDAKGRIRSIHVGFNGPGTGDQFAAQVASYYDEVQRILPHTSPNKR